MLAETFEGKYIKNRDGVPIWNSGAQTLSHRVKLFKTTGIALPVWIKGLPPPLCSDGSHKGSTNFSRNMKGVEDFNVIHKAKADRYFHDVVGNKKRKNKIIQVVTATLSSYSYEALTTQHQLDLALLFTPVSITKTN